MPLIYGHRGARGKVPENTLASFQYCLNLGVKRCELDLHLSKDNHLMVIHDTTLKRTTGRSGRINHYNKDELIEFDARRNTPKWNSPCLIPTLEELFQKCPFEHWQLEVKSASKKRAESTVMALIALISQYQMQDKVTITTSSRAILKALNKLAPHYSKGFVAEWAWLDPIKVAKSYNCQFLVLNWTLCTEARLKKAQEQGLHVSVWTVNEPNLMLRLANMQVDSLITDFPDLAKTTLENC